MNREVLWDFFFTFAQDNVISLVQLGWVLLNITEKELKDFKGQLDMLREIKEWTQLKYS